MIPKQVPHHRFLFRCPVFATQSGFRTSAFQRAPKAAARRATRVMLGICVLRLRKPWHSIKHASEQLFLGRADWENKGLGFGMAATPKVRLGAARSPPRVKSLVAPNVHSQGTDPVSAKFFSHVRPRPENWSKNRQTDKRIFPISIDPFEDPVPGMRIYSPCGGPYNDEHRRGSDYMGIPRLFLMRNTGKRLLGVPRPWVPRGFVGPLIKVSSLLSACLYF